MRSTSEKLSVLLALIFTLLLILGLSVLSLERLAQKGVEIELNSFFKIFKLGEGAKELYDSALIFCLTSTLVLISSPYLKFQTLTARLLRHGLWKVEDLDSYKKPDRLFFLRQEFKTVYRLMAFQIHISLCTILSLNLITDLEIKGQTIEALQLKIFILLCITLITVSSLKTMEVTPKDFKTWKLFWLPTWIKVLINGYDDPHDKNAVAGIIGVLLIGIAFAFLDQAIISDPILALGSLFFAAYTFGDFKETKQLLLVFWTFIACIYLISGIANCYITFLM